jgi:ABC-type protease/lipase transport system fused ATPase/permease subunit
MGSIVKAAEHARVHELVLKMPDGYNTEISEKGAKLSAGQRQRIGLARALYGEPALVVLDEPNSNLDAEGESALIQAMASVRARGGTVIVVAHRPSAISVLDQLMMISNGQVVAFGPKDEVLRKVMARPVEVPRPERNDPEPLTAVSEVRA